MIRAATAEATFLAGAIPVMADLIIPVDPTIPAPPVEATAAETAGEAATAVEVATNGRRCFCKDPYFRGIIPEIF
jgi:hypothetical protein